MDLNEAQYRSLLTKFREAIAAGEIPEVTSLSEDEKRSLLMFLPLIRKESDVDALARFLPHINTPEKVAAFALITKLGGGAIILAKATKMLASWPGLVVVVFVAWTFGGEETRQLVTQIMEALK